MSKSALLNARLIDGTGGEVIEESALVIDGDAIAGVGKRSEVSIPRDAIEIDGSGMTIMPGLIDAHMHITWLPSELDAHGHMRSNLEGVGKLQASLRCGVTTVGNQSGGYESVILRDVINEGLVRGCARVIIAGMVNATGGHVRGIAGDGPWGARKAVREQIHLVGADLIKTAASGGFQWEAERVENPDYTLEELAAVVDEAHSKAKLVHVHAHSQPGLDRAIEAGCDVIVHGAMIDRKAVEGIAAAHLHYQPTLYVTSKRVMDRENPPSTPHMLPHMYERMARAHPIHREGVRYAHELGVTLSVGTDGGPGDATQELLELRACGLSPMETIVAGTRNSAATLGILRDVGTLEVGKRADLLLLDGDPLADLFILQKPERIQLVVRDGRLEVGRGRFRQYPEVSEQYGERYQPRRVYSVRPTAN